MKRCDHCSALLQREDLIRSAAEKLFAPLCRPCDELRKDRVARYVREALDVQSEAR